MITPLLVEHCFGAAFIGRWNDYPRMIPLSELDKQAHKFIIAYFLAKSEIKPVNMYNLLQAGMFEFLRRVVVTDIRPDVFHNSMEQKSKQINQWVLTKLQTALDGIDGGEFYKKFEIYLNDESVWQKERFILKAASYIATKWEFEIVYQTSTFLKDIQKVKKSVEDEIEDYYELIGIQKIMLNKKLSHIVDLSGRLRFQKRWAKTPRIPETSVLGHMLIVAILGFFYSLKINACQSRVVNNFLCAIFHDLPEALTRDIISPVKYSVNGLDDLIAEYEMAKINDEILPNVPLHVKDEFKYILGIYENKKDEFTNRIYDKNIKLVDTLLPYNEDKYRAIDGVALKQCDKLAAFMEALISINHGIKSKELINAVMQIKQSFKQKGSINGVNFYDIAVSMEEYFKNPFSDTCGTYD